jgi:hypothetical protein
MRLEGKVTHKPIASVCDVTPCCEHALFLRERFFLLCVSFCLRWIEKSRHTVLLMYALCFIVDVYELFKLNEIHYVNVFITILIYSVDNQTWVY